MMKQLFVLLFLFPLLGCVVEESSQVVIGDNVIAVEVVDTPETRQQGLMHRETLEENSGMLFIFEEEQVHSFWMKNTLIPLDIIFISADLEIVDILQAEPCEKDPCEVYTPKDNALYVLEANKGYAEKHDIQIGDPIELKIT